VFTYQEGRRRANGVGEWKETRKGIWEDMLQMFPETKDKNTSF
jgi:hypothetical protein